MLALRRFWWKDARQFWPIGLFLIVTAAVTQAFLLRFFTDMVRSGELVGLALAWACLYGCAVGAAAFSGEREAGTLRFLDTLPVARWKLWLAKSSFAITSTLSLGLLLFAISFTGTTGWNLFGPMPFWLKLVTGVIFLFDAVCWGLFFSSFTNNALIAATLTVAFFLGFLPLATVFLDPRHGFFEHAFLRLFVSLILLTFSGIVMSRSGPPGFSILPWTLVRTRRRERRETAIIPMIDVRASSSKRLWPHEFRSLLWQTAREGRAAWLRFVGLGLFLPALMAIFGSRNGILFIILLNAAIALFAGVEIFGAENRKKTYRFLAHQGAKPGLVWLAKVVVWLAAMTAIWLPLWISRGLWAENPARATNPSFDPDMTIALSIFAALAVGQFCGMTIRRGITAAVVGVVLCLGYLSTHFALIRGGMMSPAFFLISSLAIFVVTWAWSGDWMLDRPGFGRWARLTGLVAGTAALMFSWYVGERVWGVGALPPAAQLQLVRYERSPAIPPAAENAAPLYEEAGRALRMASSVEGIATYSDVNAIPLVQRGEWDPHAKVAISWLHENGESLGLTRRASLRPSFQTRSITRTMYLNGSALPTNIRALFDLVALSALEKKSKGDIAGAWDDLAVCFRISRHFAGPVPQSAAMFGLRIERTALKIAMRWAADPGQKSETLRKAADEYRNLPKTSIADTIRAEAEILNNTLALPREDLMNLLLQIKNQGQHAYGYPSSWDQLWLTGLTTPWEVARARRISDRMAWISTLIARGDPGSRILNESDPEVPSGGNPLGVAADRYAFGNDQRQPLFRLLDPNFLGVILSNDRNEVARRALTQILALRIFQVEHGGKLPESLAELVIDAKLLDRLPDDPYSRGQPFGYVVSEGQILLPLGDFEPWEGAPEFQGGHKKIETKGDRLLFSIGPDFQSQRATVNDSQMNVQGDVIFPLHDREKTTATKDK